ncbi:unnamed protein product [Ostreobium quekettii]|uniref:Uncharacterized protein n=1 Tax=Ostreobium quekettii TaxID=121088 RepID=A0A8S1IW25_9CHLO|nr:unnamed protein product [Ostreobium quekettii]
MAGRRGDIWSWCGAAPTGARVPTSKRPSPRARRPTIRDAAGPHSADSPPLSSAIPSESGHNQVYNRTQGISQSATSFVHACIRAMPNLASFTKWSHYTSPLSSLLSELVFPISCIGDLFSPTFLPSRIAHSSTPSCRRTPPFSAQGGLLTSPTSRLAVDPYSNACSQGYSKSLYPWETDPNY